jgi:hypothetical protein
MLATSADHATGTSASNVLALTTRDLTGSGFGRHNRQSSMPDSDNGTLFK